MKVPSGSQLELGAPMKLVWCFQASVLHPIKAENAHAFMQFLAFIFHFFYYINWWFTVSFHCLDFFVRQLTPFCTPAWMVVLCSCSTPFCVLSKPRTRMIQMLRECNTEFSGQLSSSALSLSHTSMLNLNRSYQRSNEAPRNITLRNTSISKSKPLSWIPEAWGKGKWFLKLIKELLLQAKLCSCNELSERVQDWLFSYDYEQRRPGLCWCSLQYRDLL